MAMCRITADVGHPKCQFRSSGTPNIFLFLFHSLTTPTHTASDIQEMASIRRNNKCIIADFDALPPCIQKAFDLTTVELWNSFEEPYDVLKDIWILVVSIRLQMVLWRSKKPRCI